MILLVGYLFAQQQAAAVALLVFRLLVAMLGHNQGTVQAAAGLMLLR